jgi:hypothetical protein
MMFAVYCNRGVRWITRFSGIRAYLEENEAVVAAVLVLAGYSGHETKSGGHGSRKKSFGDREVADFFGVRCLGECLKSMVPSIEKGWDNGT